MLDKAQAKGIVASYGSMHETFGHIKSLAEIPLFHGDQWEITVPSLLGIDADEPNDPKKPKTKVDPKKLLRMDAKDVVLKAKQEMQHLKRHFLVVVMNDPEEPPKKDEDPVISTDLTDTRQSFLGQCQMCHWQFNSLRHAQYATMMILQHIHNKPSYCIESCVRGRVEDGSFMVGCDQCAAAAALEPAGPTAVAPPAAREVAGPASPALARDPNDAARHKAAPPPHQGRTPSQGRTPNPAGATTGTTATASASRKRRRARCRSTSAPGARRRAWAAGRRQVAALEELAR